MLSIGQCTLTDKYVSAHWNTNRKANMISKQVVKRVHYRMASVEVGYPLDTFRGLKELIHGGRCAFLGKTKSVYVAFAKAKLCCIFSRLGCSCSVWSSPS